MKYSPSLKINGISLHVIPQGETTFFNGSFKPVQEKSIEYDEKSTQKKYSHVRI